MKFTYEGPKGVHNEEQQRTQRIHNERRARELARLTRFNSVNLAVDVPRGGWTQLESAESETNLCLRLAVSRPEIRVSLAAEAVGIDADETNESFLLTSQEKLKNLPEGVVLPGVRKLSGLGIEGREFQATATFDTGIQLRYSIWVASRHGYNYSLVVYGDQRHTRAIDNTLKQFVRRLRQIESYRVAHVTAEPVARR